MRRRRWTNPAPAGLLLLAAVIRLLCEPGAAEEPTAPTAREMPVAIVEATVTPRDLNIAAVPEPAAVAVQAEAAAEPVAAAAAATALEWNSAAMESLAVRNQTGYIVSPEELAGQPLAFDETAEGPTILLIHTHTTEAYTPEPGWEYEASDLMRTMDSDYNMVRIGDEVERVLTEAGFWVIHDESVNDYPSYNNSYWTALERIEAWQARYPSIQMVIDLHRDAAADAQGQFVRTSCTYGDEDMAQLMLVCGSDYGGLEHPNWRQNLAFALQLQLRLELMRPGICRPLDLRCERFNQHATPLSLLVEVGTVGDTLARAIPAAEQLGIALAEVLKGI